MMESFNYKENLIKNSHKVSIVTLSTIRDSNNNSSFAPIKVNSFGITSLPKEMIEMKYIERTLSIINLAFILFGTFGNLLTFSILMRKNVRKHSCMRYLAALSILDLFCLYTWNFSLLYSMVSNGNKKIEHEGSLICRIFSFFCYFILQSSSWIICSIGMDRIITMVMKTATNRITKIAKNTKIVTLSVIILCFSFNFVVLFNNAEPYVMPSIIDKNVSDEYKISISSNLTLSTKVILANSSQIRTYTCYEPRKFFAFWDVMHIFMYSLFPFFIILFENVILSYLTIRHSKKMKRHHLNASYPARLKDIIASSECDGNEKFTLKEKIIQRFDKKKRVYRKTVNIRLTTAIEGQSSTTTSLNNLNGINIINNKTTSEISNLQLNTPEKIISVQKKRNKKLQTKTSHVANLLLFLTVSFLFTTVPYSTYYALGVNIYFDYKAKKIVVGILTIMQYTRHSANFLIYLFTSSIIKTEMKMMISDFNKHFRRKLIV